MFRISQKLSLMAIGAVLAAGCSSGITEDVLAPTGQVQADGNQLAGQVGQLGTPEPTLNNGEQAATLPTVSPSSEATLPGSDTTDQTGDQATTAATATQSNQSSTATTAASQQSTQNTKQVVATTSQTSSTEASSTAPQGTTATTAAATATTSKKAAAQAKPAAADCLAGQWNANASQVRSEVQRQAQAVDIPNVKVTVNDAAMTGTINADGTATFLTSANITAKVSGFSVPGTAATTLVGTWKATGSDLTYTVTAYSMVVNILAQDYTPTITNIVGTSMSGSFSCQSGTLKLNMGNGALSLPSDWTGA